MKDNSQMSIDDLTYKIIEICIKIHKKLGPCCFEKVYEEILCYELTKLGYKVLRQVYLPITWEILLVKNAYKTDLIINDRLVIELKTLNPLPSVYFTQIKTLLTLLKLKHGLMINFKVSKLTEGIYRVYNNSGEEFLEFPIGF